MHCRAAMCKQVCSLAVVLCGKQAEAEQGPRGGATRAAASARCQSRLPVLVLPQLASHAPRVLRVPSAA